MSNSKNFVSNWCNENNDPSDANTADMLLFVKNSSENSSSITSLTNSTTCTEVLSVTRPLDEQQTTIPMVNNDSSKHQGFVIISDDDETGTTSTTTTKTVFQYPHEIMQRKVLMDLYIQCNGRNWYNNSGWGTEEDVSTWFGITTDKRNKAVIRIELGKNNLIGKLPEQLGLLKRLKTLSLPQNKISGSLPIALSNCEYLENLNLIANQITGFIPKEYGRLKKINRFFLQHNQLIGSIPSEFQNWPSLQHFNVSSNNGMSGIVPIQLLTKFKKLKGSFDISGTNLQRESMSQQTHSDNDNECHNKQQLILGRKRTYDDTVATTETTTAAIVDNDINSTRTVRRPNIHLTQSNKVKILEEVENRNGRNNHEIAKKYGINERTLRRLIKKKKLILDNMGDPLRKHFRKDKRQIQIQQQQQQQQQQDQEQQPPLKKQCRFRLPHIQQNMMQETELKQLSTNVKVTTGTAQNKNVVVLDDVQQPYFEKITMKDGINLSARIWKPNMQNKQEFPVILEYDAKWTSVCSSIEDEKRMHFFAENGFVCIRVDVRGTGDSEHNLENNHKFDPHTEIEESDCIQVINWISSQSWCIGNIAMIGKGRGGTTALQVAASQRKPTELKAIIVSNATDDRYKHGICFSGDCLLGQSMLKRGNQLNAWSLRPPNPAVIGGHIQNFETIWKNRLESFSPITENWLSNQDSNDLYWQSKIYNNNNINNINESINKIDIPIFLWDGFNSFTKNAFFTLLETLPSSTPRRAIIGPWGDEGPPENNVFLTECLNWFNQYLLVDNKFNEVPNIRAFLSQVTSVSQQQQQPQYLTEGKWIGRMEYRSDLKSKYKIYAITAERDLLEDGSELKSREATKYINIPSFIEHGRGSGDGFNGLPLNQIHDDQYSLNFSTKPLPYEMQLFGNPKVVLHVLKKEIDAMVTVRLCLINPNKASSKSLLLSRAVKKIPYNHGESILNKIEFDMNAVGFVIPKGYILQFSIAQNYFPYVWNCRTRATIKLATGKYMQSKILIPLQPTEQHCKRANTHLSNLLQQNETLPSTVTTQHKLLHQPKYRKEYKFIEDNMERKKLEINITDNTGTKIIPQHKYTNYTKIASTTDNRNENCGRDKKNFILYNEQSDEKYEINSIDDPLSAKGKSYRKIEIKFPSAKNNDDKKSIDATVEIWAQLTGNSQFYDLKHFIRATYNNKIIHEKKFSKQIPKKIYTNYIKVNLPNVQQK